MRAQPVVVGVDGSPESLRAAVIGSRIARTSSSECILVYAVPVLWTPDGVTDVSISSAIIDRLKGPVCKALAQAAVDDEVIARAGKPGVVLNRVARERGAGLIVVGERHHGALSRGLGGSTAHHLVRTADVPVLVVEPRTEPINRVLAAVDLSHAGGQTLRAAASHAALLGARLRAVHVVEPAKFPVVVGLSLDPAEYERRCRDEFHRLIETELPDLPPDDRVVRTGISDEEIAEEAAAWRADLVVIGSHGKARIDRLLIGSTTERLLNRQSASLLVVPIRRPASKRRIVRRRGRARGGRQTVGIKQPGRW